MAHAYRAELVHPSFDDRVARLAVIQHGAFAREQLSSLGATRGMIQHRLAAGRWDRVALNVFCIAGGPASWPRSLMAASLAWGNAATISHRSAAALWRLAGFEPGPIELTVPRRRRRQGVGFAHRNALFAVDVTTVDGIPVTTPARTLIDVASVASRDMVEEALDDALRRKMVSMRRMRWRLGEVGGGGGRPGVSVMRSLLDAREHGGAPQSVLETRLLRVLEHAGLPKPALQYEITDATGKTAIVDFAFPAERVAIEADGYRWHSGRARWQSDLARRNRITSLGWHVVHVTWADLHHRPDAVIDSLVRTLATRQITDPPSGGA